MILTYVDFDLYYSLIEIPILMQQELYFRTQRENTFIELGLHWALQTDQTCVELVEKNNRYFQTMA